MKSLLITSLTALSLLTPATAQAATCTWSTTDLPLPADTRLSLITGGADDGSWVLGWGDSAEKGNVLLLWHHGEVLAERIGVGEVPHDVDVTRTVITSGSDGRAWRGSMGLNPLPGANWASAAAINHYGRIAGRSGGSVVVWGASADPQAIAGTDDGGTYQVEDIDDEGRVGAARYGAQGEAVQSYLWDAAGTRSTLQAPEGYRHTVVRAVRNGQAVGFAAKDGWADQVGVVWDAQGVVRVLPGAAEAVDVNAKGDVVGTTTSGSSAVWRHSGQVEPLPAGIYEKFADTGALYGRVYRDGTFTPFEAYCG
ncbi:hypothetical protein BBK82_23050 [Lentzea guizhouensis]|uniref:HAF repeat-containing protein n=1 Tax=Lentzea guizhouensis TaxID=1586287 RepID=A0A1B2HLB6_9PSEU|nr:hypothetical protein [Lentzea guizhouensis]ANZ38509.1 hypothetical protein BBK82_23050 [Lentzea guizhouensis]